MIFNGWILFVRVTPQQDETLQVQAEVERP